MTSQQHEMMDKDEDLNHLRTQKAHAENQNKRLFEQNQHLLNQNSDHRRENQYLNSQVK